MVHQKTHLKKIKVEDSVGLPLAHDITEIRPDEFKGVAFKRGHLVEKKDINHLIRLGKRHLFVLDIHENYVHEDDAVFELAKSLSGKGIIFDDTPKEGKLELLAEYPGLLKINVDSLINFNLIQDVMCASIHTNTPVKKGQKIAGTRAIPLMIKREILDNALQIAIKNSPIFTIKQFKPFKVRLVITGSEVYQGLIEDRFQNIVEKKVKSLGSKLSETIILPDDRKIIADKIREFFNKDTTLFIKLNYV